MSNDKGITNVSIKRDDDGSSNSSDKAQLQKFKDYEPNTRSELPATGSEGEMLLTIKEVYDDTCSIALSSMHGSVSSGSSESSL